MSKILTIIVGGGGHCTVVMDTLIKSGHMIDMICDQNPEQLKDQKVNLNIQKIPLEEWWNTYQTQSIIAIGSNHIRKKMASLLRYTTWLQSIHPTALIHESAIIGQGVHISANVTIQANVQIGSHSIINTGTIIEHDCFVGEYCHIAPGSILTGNVHIDKGAFIGAGTVIIPNKKIGKWAVIGAGSVVIKDIPPYKKAFGVPCRVVESIDAVIEEY